MTTTLDCLPKKVTSKMYEYLYIIYLSRLTVALHGIGECWSSPQPVCFLEVKESDYINGRLSAF